MDPDFSATDGVHFGDRPVVVDTGLATTKTMAAAACFLRVVGHKHGPLRSPAKMEHVNAFSAWAGTLSI